MSLETVITALAQAIGADIKSLTNNKVSTVAGKGLSPLTKEYVSPESAIAANGSATLTHDLGSMPKLVTISVVCKIAEMGFVVGEEAMIGTVFTGVATGTNVGIQLASSTTTIRLKISSAGIAVGNMSTGVPAIITNSNWRMIIRAYA